MLIKSKKSKIHAGKVFEMREGVNGSGKPVLVIQTGVKEAWHTETFTNLKEGEAWWRYACK